MGRLGRGGRRTGRTGSDADDEDPVQREDVGVDDTGLELLGDCRDGRN
jgi:hypothetical protein